MRKRLVWLGHLVLGLGGIALHRILLESIEEKLSQQNLLRKCTQSQRLDQGHCTD